MAELIIHRGSHQIGGICAEIRTKKTRLIIDFGENLPGTNEGVTISDDEMLDRVFANGDKPAAVLFTHYHSDHIGLVDKIPNDIPLYIGPTAKQLLQNLNYRTDFFKEEKLLPIIKKMNTYTAGAPQKFGDITVTPFQIGHSALDSYMFLIEADGKKILYTGDFRDHGIVCSKPTFDKLLEKCVRKIDVLVTEGTMFSRSEETVMNECELCKNAREIFSKHKYNFVLVSSTNLDSIMSFYHAMPKGKPFVCDYYQLIQILAANERFRTENKIGYLMYNLNSLIRTIDNQKDNKHFIGIDGLKEKGFVMLVRATDKFKPFLEMFDKSEACLVYSMWDGYLEGGKSENKAIIDFIKGWEEIPLHTSGHASIDCIKNLIEKTRPAVIIPMHSECPEEMPNISEFREYKDRIRVLNDGEAFDI